MSETFELHSQLHSRHPNHNTYAQSETVLSSGMLYRVRVDGNCTYYSGQTLLHGENWVVKYPKLGASPTQEASEDAEVWFADQTTTDVPEHHSRFAFDLGSGWVHHEPIGGPFSAVQPGHIYEYDLVGEGNVLKASINDSFMDDNSGTFKITIGWWIVGSVAFG